MTRLLFLCLLSLLLAACATAPAFDTEQVERSVTPAYALNQPEAAQGRTAMWGGVILSGRNLKDSTQLEVLAFPVDEQGRPNRDTQPYGRFILTRQGYLETADYAPGRLVTAIGPVQGTEQGKVGETDYTYPLLRAEQLHLWPTARTTDTSTRFHFGIGVIFR